MMSEYTHQELGNHIEAPAGHYTPKKEIRLKYDGREVLYIVNETVVDSSCCDVGDFASALVPGYIVKWKTEKNSNGTPVSVVEPITDKKVQDNIRKIIGETEQVSRTEFW